MVAHNSFVQLKMKFITLNDGNYKILSVRKLQIDFIKINVFPLLVPDPV